MLADEKFDKLVLSENVTIRTAMSAIERTGIGITLIVNPEKKLLGTLTDGDIRRALLSGAKLDDRVGAYMSRDCIFVNAHAGRAEVLDLMHARWFNLIPVVDNHGTLVGLHTIHQVLGCQERPNWAVIMAGGKGTRLRPITENIPKPMVSVAGRPILERLVLHLVSYGIRQIFIAVNYLSHIIENHFEDGSLFGCQIKYLREDEPLGTGGALSLLPEIPEHPLLVMNGDLVMQTNFAELLRFHSEGSYYATMGLRPYSHQVPFGCVETQGDRIIELEEKPLLEKHVNAGSYVLSPAAVQAVPKDKMFPITDLFKNAIISNLSCGACLIADDWMDIAEPIDLQKANGFQQ